MINILKIPATIQEIYNDPARERSAFLKLEIVPGEVFRIGDSMLKILCEELNQGVAFTECGRTDILPCGISRNAQIEKGRLLTTIEVLKGLKYGGTHSFASTDGLIRGIEEKIIVNFFIGLGNVISECDNCKKAFSPWPNRSCAHWPGDKNEEEKVNTYMVKEAWVMIVSTVTLKVTDYENIELLTRSHELDEIDKIKAMKEDLKRGPRILTKGAHHRFD